MNGQNFAFNGYLPINNKEQIKKIKQLESLSKKTGQTQIFMETPYRNNKLLKTLTNVCGNNTMLCVASNITQENDVDFSIRLIEEFKIASIPVSVFYNSPLDEKVLRFCFAKKDDTILKAAEILQGI